MWLNEDACIKCSICVSVCPVYIQDLEFPGPKILGPDWYRSYVHGSKDIIPHVDDCTFCQLCEAACPVNVPIAHLIALQKSLQKLGLRKRLRNTIFSHPALLARFPQATKTPKFLAAMMKISTKTNWPQVAISRVTMPSQTGPATKPKEVVGLYVDCYTSGFDREVLDSALALLELWEFEVLQLPGDTHCCGAAAFAGGNLKTAQKLAKSTYSSIVASLPNISALVTLNATCDGTIRDEWPKYWGIEVSTPVMPFTDFAIERAPASFWQDLNGRDSPNDETTTWVHTTCRSKVARGDAPLLSLAALGHLPNVRELDLACCGAAGSFAFKEEHQEVAHGMGENILSQIHANGREQIVVDSGTCAIHLAQISGIPAKHPAYWLYERYLEIGVSNGCD